MAALWEGAGVGEGYEGWGKGYNGLGKSRIFGKCEEGEG